MRVELVGSAIFAVVVCGFVFAWNANANETAQDTESGPSVESPPGAVKALTKEELETLLATRLEGGMGHTFIQFANMFFVSSGIQLGVQVGLIATTDDIADKELMSPFPASYKPTLREFLDTIALQTFSEWTYDPSGKHLKIEASVETPVENFAFFEFRPSKRDKPFSITLAEGWKASDKGNWTMYVPPTFPVGMDIYEMGTFSSDMTPPDSDFATKIRTAVALDWAKRVKPDAEEKDLRSAKVGPFDALYGEFLISTKQNGELVWRQWLFMVGNKCYFVLSTLPPDQEERLVPDIQTMLESFRAETKH